MERYLAEIAKIQLLTPDEETILARRIKEGDTDALGILIKSNLRFVVSVAKQYQNKGLSLVDLVNEGNLGLIKATKNLMNRAGLNSFRMQCGGFVSLLCRLLQNILALFAFLSIK